MHLQLPMHHHTIPLTMKGTPEDNSGPSQDEGKPDLSFDADTGHGGRVLVCKVCRSIITRRNLGMEIDGKHLHVFFNPHGYVFELGCFASAKNIIPTGPKTDEFTWFPNYAWQVVACSGCQEQLGWRYTGDKGGFYGLIVKALIEEEGRKA